MAAATPPPQPALPEIRDIAPPVEVFPWPWWVVALGILGLLLVIVTLAWLIRRVMPRRATVPPLTPRQVAFRELEALRGQIGKLAPYDFSVRVSDVLRTFVSAHFGLRATQQTSPEFLASISHAAEFSQSDRDLLARFLERCDLIKFAHIDATETDSAELLSSAIAFVQGSRA
jgi:hypothetical protein